MLLYMRDNMFDVMLANCHYFNQVDKYMSFQEAMATSRHACSRLVHTRK